MNNNVIESMAVNGMETEKEGDITMNAIKPAYTFRMLNSTDVFLMFKIISKIGINDFAKSFDKDSIKELLDSAKSDGSATTMIGISVMLDMANAILGNLPKCESEIFQMLSNTSNLTVDQVKALDFATFTEMVIDFVKKEEFKDFIKVVSRLFKPAN